MRFVRAAQFGNRTPIARARSRQAQAAAVGKAAVSGIDWRSKALMVSGIGAPMEVGRASPVLAREGAGWPVCPVESPDCHRFTRVTLIPG